MGLFSRKKKKEEAAPLTIGDLIHKQMEKHRTTACLEDLPLAGSMSDTVEVSNHHSVPHIMTYDIDTEYELESLIAAIHDVLWHIRPHIQVATGEDNLEQFAYSPILIAMLLHHCYTEFNYKHYEEDIPWKLTLLFTGDTCIEKEVNGITFKVFKKEEEPGVADTYSLDDDEDF